MPPQPGRGGAGLRQESRVSVDLVGPGSTHSGRDLICVTGAMRASQVVRVAACLTEMLCDPREVVAWSQRWGPEQSLCSARALDSEVPRHLCDGPARPQRGLQGD